MERERLRSSEIDYYIDENGFILSDSDSDDDNNEVNYVEEDDYVRETSGSESNSDDGAVSVAMDVDDLEIDPDIEMGPEPVNIELVHIEPVNIVAVNIEPVNVEPRPNETTVDNVINRVASGEIGVVDESTVDNIINRVASGEIGPITIEEPRPINIEEPRPINIEPIGLDDVVEENIENIINGVAAGDIGLWNVPLWRDEPNEPKNIVFSGHNVGVNIPNIEAIETELDCFNHFFSDDIVEHIVEQTNLYANKCLADESRRKRKDDSK